MKRTLAFGLFLALIPGVGAQTPTVVEKPAANSTAKPAVVKVTAKPAAHAASTKPSPATVKPSTVKPAANAASKPAVVAVQPVNAKAVAAVKANIANGKPVTAAAKTGSSLPAKAMVTPATKAGTSSSTKPVVAVKAQPVPATGHAVAAVPAARMALAPKAGSAVAVKNGAPQTLAKNSKGVSKPAAKPAVAKIQPAVAKPGATVAVKDTKTVAENKPAPRKIDAAGRRDPFVSPVVNLGAVGSGCTSGKRCLAIDQVALRGVVRSDNGMIAVVVNAMDKAYFLRENDPVFNGYVVKITVDSIVFKETFRDKLGKPLTRDVTKTISRPVA